MLKRTVVIAMCLLGTCALQAQEPSRDSASSRNSSLKPRLVVLTDIKDFEPDDQQSLTRLLSHADLYEIEGIVISTSWGIKDVHEHLDSKDIAMSVIDAYEKDLPNLLGYLRLYRNTGDERYLRTVQNAWQDITANHLDVAGGPWGRHMDYNGNRECFAHPRDFDPAAADVETCSTTTWVQLNLHMLELTGEARYATEAERAVFNALLAAQHENGLDWCYYTGRG